MLIFILACIAGAVVIYLRYQYDKRKREAQEQELEQQILNLNNAETAYRQELKKLKLSPTNADLKENTLRLGRRFSELTRELYGQNGVTIYDELALMNDINAACAAAASTQPEINTQIEQTIDQRLAKLSELRLKNLISEKEYETRRQKILDEI